MENQIQDALREVASAQDFVRVTVDGGFGYQWLTGGTYTAIRRPINKHRQMQVTLPGVDVPAVVYESGDDLVTRYASVNGRSSVQSLPAPTVESAGDQAFSRWWWSWLRDRRSPQWRQGGKSLSIVELFCGAGGLGLGACEAARAVGMTPSILLAVDHDQAALDVYAANLPVLSPLRANVAGLTSYVLAGSRFSPCLAEHPVLLEPRLAYAERKVDLFLAGPPCEGHSNFNNHTRRDDPRNGLYLDAVAIAVGLGGARDRHRERPRGKE